MEINKTRNKYYIIISLSVILLLMLGSWWLYLVFKLAFKLQDLNHPLIEGNLISMIKWEGLTFFTCLTLLTITLLYIYVQDHKKTKALQAFFASLTHELKTPLASMKLQTQVLVDHLMDLNINNEEKQIILKYANRFSDDNARLEDQLDNHLQLSRVERNASLNLNEISFSQLLKNEIKRFPDHLEIDYSQVPNDLKLFTDEFALKTILRNLIDNSIKHAKSDPLNITITAHESKVRYSDNGKKFSGDTKRLGSLFYKHHSPQGSGIGVYIIKKLMLQMKGSLIITNHNSLQFHLNFPKKEDL